MRARIEKSAAHLEVLSREPKTIDPGRYRVYLAPVALDEVFGLVSWGGFGLKSHRTKYSPLQRLVSGFSRCVSKRKIEKNGPRGIHRPGYRVRAGKADCGNPPRFNLPGNQSHGLMAYGSHGDQYCDIDLVFDQAFGKCGGKQVLHPARRVDASHERVGRGGQFPNPAYRRDIA